MKTAATHQAPAPRTVPPPNRSERSVRLVWLRFWLLGGLAFAVLSAPTFLDIPLPQAPLLSVLGLLVVFNLLTLWRPDGTERTAGESAMQLSVDLFGLGVLLYLSGGAANPLVSLLLYPVVVAALALSGAWVIAISLLAIAIYSFLMVFFLPLPIADIERATRLHLGGMWLTFVASALMAAWFITRMTGSIRARDAQLAAVREQALRDAQVVAIGQLAAGAAHELGTPLATMNVLAGELLNDEKLPSDARSDLALLRQQIGICKEIVGGLTEKAGIERAGRTLPFVEWLNGLLVRWRTLWPRANCQLQVQGEGPSPVVRLDATIEQAIMNLLNNAARIAPQGMTLVMDWDETWVRMALQDRGPGFPADILRRCGNKPLVAASDGNGIGLWLTRSAVERCGGQLSLENNADGACATILLPRH